MLLPTLKVADEPFIRTVADPNVFVPDGLLTKFWAKVTDPLSEILISPTEELSPRNTNMPLNEALSETLR
jgi:hypothetical protein